METEKIYYADCHCATFRARVLECSETEGGFAVTLDRTAFYPLGGGQAADTGTLGGVRVLDTREEGEKIVLGGGVQQLQKRPQAEKARRGNDKACAKPDDQRPEIGRAHV